MNDTIVINAGSILPRPAITERLEVAFGAVELAEYHLERRQCFRLHTEKNVLEMVLAERREPTFLSFLTLPSLGSRPIGDAVFLPADQMVEIDAAPGRQRVIRCSFWGFEEDEPRLWSAKELAAGLDVRSEPVRKALLVLAEEMISPGFKSSLLAGSLAAVVAVELGRYFRRLIEPALPGRLSARQLRLIEERIEQEGSLPTAAELARECGLSKRHFFRLFRQSTGTSPLDYAVRRRIDRAKTLLREEGLVVKQIAHRCGFQTSAAFSAAFRRETGMSPREYRMSGAIPLL